MKPKCDWCQSEECRDTGGLDWGRFPIYVCKCGHEFVVTSLAREKTDSELTAEWNRLMDQAVLGFGLDEGQQRRLDALEKKLRKK